MTSNTLPMVCPDCGHLYDVGDAIIPCGCCGFENLVSISTFAYEQLS